jgi:sarcosine oxidase
VPPTYDVIVIGLGGMGSATAYQLALRGERVLGLERFSPAHDKGSSHGRSRIIRQAYFEGPDYVPLLLRAYELWEQIERDTGQELLTVTGGLMMGPPDSATVTGSRLSAEKWGLEHEMLDAAEISRRFPTLRPGPEIVGLHEANAGFVRPEAGVAAHLERAERLGAELEFGAAAIGWKASDGGEGVSVRTADATYEGRGLVIAPGSWAPRVLSELGLPLRVERQVQFWFAPRDGLGPFEVGRHPIYIWETESGVQFYGFPAHGPPEDGVKVAFFRMGHDTDPDRLDTKVHEHEIELMRSYLLDRIPQLAGEFVRGEPCLYTTTPDEHFVISTHPAHTQVAVAAGFSGHGYKFASVVGEVLADLVTEGKTKYPIGLFDPARFG